MIFEGRIRFFLTVGSGFSGRSDPGLSPKVNINVLIIFGGCTTCAYPRILQKKIGFSSGQKY